ncbi:MAG: hypothetical protein ABT940_13405 [Alphaproteobacteria bacterium]
MPRTAIVDKYAEMAGRAVILGMCGHHGEEGQLLARMDTMIANDFPKTRAGAEEAYSYWAGYIGGMKSSFAGVAGYAVTSVSAGSCSVLRMEVKDSLAN